MKKISMFLMGALVCLFLATGSSHVMAQDATNTETARTEDSSDWGLLGLLGLIGLLGLKKKVPETDIDIEGRT